MQISSIHTLRMPQAADRDVRSFSARIPRADYEGLAALSALSGKSRNTILVEALQEHLRRQDTKAVNAMIRKARAKLGKQG